MRKVLIAVDETKGTAATLSVFRNLVRPPEEVVLVHVQKPGGKSLMYDMLGEAEMSTLRESLEGSDYKAELDRKAEKVLDTYKKEIESGGLIKVKTMVRFGQPTDEILKVASEENADFIIMGCNGKKGIHRLITGCVTRDVEKESGVPVLIAKAEGCKEADYVWKQSCAACSSY